MQKCFYFIPAMNVFLMHNSNSYFGGLLIVLLRTCKLRVFTAACNFLSQTHISFLMRVVLSSLLSLVF